MVEECCTRDAIRHLLARYTYAGDRGQIAELADCFAPDGVLEYPGRRAVGPQAIITALTGGANSLPDPARTFVRHHITNPLIELDGDTARARSYFTVWSNRGPDHAGTYDDVLVARPEGWRFAHRRVRIDWQSEVTLFHPMVPRLA